MRFTYFKKTGEFRDKHGEWDGDDGFEFDYDVDRADLLDAVCDIVDMCYFGKTLDLTKFKKFVREFDLIDILAEEFRDDLHEYFEDEALDSVD